MYRQVIGCVAVGLLLSAGATDASAADHGGSSGVARSETKWAPAVPPKPLSENVQRGLDWLVKHQLESGAWQ